METSADRYISLRTHEYLVTLNGRQMRVYCPPSGLPEVDGLAVEAVLLVSPEGVGTLELAGRRFRITFDPDGEQGEDRGMTVNGRRTAVRVDDRRSLLRQQMQKSEESASAVVTVKAPMPGLVLKVLVKAGHTVAKGDGLVVLEAMKMENEVRAERSGVVESVMIEERGPVEKGQVLLVIKAI
jgi:pyruvate carboxylase subunit B